MRRNTPPPAAKNNSRNSVSLQRFVNAQESGLPPGHPGGHPGGHPPYSQAFQEIASGRKKSHWIWYIFPQINDPGRRSDLNSEFQIFNRLEACMYLRHVPENAKNANPPPPTSLRFNLVSILCTVMRHLASDQVASKIAESRNLFLAHSKGLAGLAEGGGSQVSEASLNASAKSMMRAQGGSLPAVASSSSSGDLDRSIRIIFHGMTDAKKCYHCATTFALAAIEAVEPAPVLKFFADLLDVIVASLRVDLEAALRAQPNLKPSDSIIQYPPPLEEEQQEVTLSEDHPFAKKSETEKNTFNLRTDITQEESSLFFASVLAARRIVSLAEPVMLAKWNYEMTPITASSGLWSSSPCTADEGSGAKVVPVVESSEDAEDQKSSEDKKKQQNCGSAGCSLQ